MQSSGIQIDLKIFSENFYAKLCRAYKYMETIQENNAKLAINKLPPLSSDLKPQRRTPSLCAAKFNVRTPVSLHLKCHFYCLFQ